MKYRLNIIKVYSEVYLSRFLRVFGIKKSTEPIPSNTPYCYLPDEEKNKLEEEGNKNWIKPCKYYRFLYGDSPAGCTYVGYIGRDPLLKDQCKICGVKEHSETFEVETENLEN